jgi:hypothetical protein
MGASYPVRTGAPNSNVVQNVDEWANDWQGRWDSAQAQVRPAGVVGRTAAKSGTGSIAPGFAGPAPTNTGSFVTVQSSPYSGVASDGGARSVDFSGGGDVFSAGYAPDMRALMAERDQIDLTRQAGITNQQAYDSMRGWGQNNGVMAPNYGEAGFGQVNGVNGDPYALQGDTQGLDMSWTDGIYSAQNPGAGVYSAQNAGAGVYSPAAPRSNRGWSLW